LDCGPHCQWTVPPTTDGGAGNIPSLALPFSLRRHHITSVPKRIAFIEPSAPVLRREPPIGPEWLHEVKHDGWRAQLHVSDSKSIIYSKRGIDLTCRFRPIAIASATLPCNSAVIDAELVACDEAGLPSFGALMTGAPHGCCAWCFDLLELDGTA
jgi:bifunctional non-homologous end joining protein LigD